MLRGIQQFRRCDKGNIAIITPVAMLPIISLVLGGLELNEVSRVTQSMQTAADHAVLAAFEQPQLGWSQRIRRADGFFDSNFSDRERVTGLSRKLSGRQTRRRVELSYRASAKVDSFFGDKSPFSNGIVTVVAHAVYDAGSSRPPRLVSVQSGAKKSSNE